MLGTGQCIVWMQRLGLGLLQIFENDGGFEDRPVADLQHRRLAERRDREKPVRLVAEINVDPLEGDALLRQRDHRALHVGAEFVADQFERRGHGILDGSCRCI
jgi:hypothetical protein